MLHCVPCNMRIAAGGADKIRFAHTESDRQRSMNIYLVFFCGGGG